MGTRKCINAHVFHFRALRNKPASRFTAHCQAIYMELLCLWVDSADETGVQVSVVQLADLARVSLATVKRHKKLLTKAGLIKFAPGKKGKPGIWTILPPPAAVYAQYTVQQEQALEPVAVPVQEVVREPDVQPPKKPIDFSLNIPEDYEHTPPMPEKLKRAVLKAAHQGAIDEHLTMHLVARKYRYNFRSGKDGKFIKEILSELLDAIYKDEYYGLQGCTDYSIVVNKLISEYQSFFGYCHSIRDPYMQKNFGLQAMRGKVNNYLNDKYNEDKIDDAFNYRDENTDENGKFISPRERQQQRAREEAERAERERLHQEELARTERERAKRSVERNRLRWDKQYRDAKFDEAFDEYLRRKSSAGAKTGIAT